MKSPGPVLRDIHFPQVSWWPPAIGWWLAAALLLLTAGIAFFTWRRGRNRRALRRAARRELDAITARHASDRDDALLAAGVSRLLRRIALLLQPGVVASNETAWREFLSSGTQALFTDEQLDTLISAPYRPHVSFDADALLGSARQWCERALRARSFRNSPYPDPLLRGDKKTGALRVAGDEGFAAMGLRR